MPESILRLKKGEERRIRAGHPWVYSNEIDTAFSPLKSFSAGQEVLITAFDDTFIAKAYVNPHSLITARVITRQPNEPFDFHFFKRELHQALLLRERLFDKSYYRLVFGEADRLPGLIIDRFANDYVLQINTAGMELKKDCIIEALSSLLPEINSILLRNDNAIREQEGLARYIAAAVGHPPEEIRLEENGVLFFAPLSKGQKTGWFYDHRNNRARLRQYVQGAKVLDVFSYVGAWGIQAAAFGAKHIDCIDVSSHACAFITKNAEHNRCTSKLSVINEDAFDAMKNLLHNHKTYDVIILDPPAFVKKRKDRQEGTLAYQRLNELALKLLSKNGILITCSCSMHISMDDLFQVLQRAAFRTKSSIQILERGHQGPDHPIHVHIPETDYLKAVIARKIE